jgi:threonine/homoserine efflux transporter RhtA
MNDSSRTQGGLICIGVVIVGAWFLLGLLQQSYWALAIPVAVLVFFLLGLCFWVGYTIATIQIDPYQDGEGGGTAESTEGEAGRDGAG